MTKFKVLHLIALLLLSIGIKAESWNILIYMAADNGLASAAVQDFNSMELAAVPSDTKVWLQTDFPPDHSLSGTRRWELRHDSSEQIASRQISHLGNLSSGSVQTLRDFISWGSDRYQADRTMLILWSHGGGWGKADEAKWICPDYTTEEALSVASGDLKAALSGYPRFDILLMDACSMQTIEVADEVKGFADYVIGSVELVPVTGFPYPEILPLFSQSLPSILQQIPILYAASYAVGGSQNPHSGDLVSTCSVLSTSTLSSVVDHWGDFSRDYRLQANEFFPWREQCYPLNNHQDIDLGQFLSIMEANTTDLELRSRVQELLQLWDTVVISQANSGIEEEIGSAAIWFPLYQYIYTNTWEYYSQLDFARTRWQSFLNYAWDYPGIPPSGNVQNLKVEQYPGHLLLSFDPVAHPDSVYYEVEHSDPGFTALTYYPMMSSGTISIPVNAPLTGTFYVRTVYPEGQISEGSLYYSFIETGAQLLVYPNPGRASLRASWSLSKQPDSPVTLRIFNTRGQVVWERSLSAEQQAYHFLGAEPALQNLPAGIYFLRLSTRGETLSSRLVIL